METPAQFIDHTLLKPETTEGEVARLCEEAVEYSFASVCIPPCYVSSAARSLYGSDVAVGTVIGFPLGYESSAVKAWQAEQAFQAGARELDMVIRIGAVRDEAYDLLQADILGVVEATPGALVKVIIECCLLEDDQKKRMVDIVVAAGADYVKTSTGFAATGATLDDVRLLSSAAAGRIKVKAAGGIRDLTVFEAMCSAGADRIGTSAGVAIVDEWRRDVGLR
jgi:deoxyribose-phosphate aldolase